MVGAAIKGVSKILKKSGKKARRGTPTKAGMVARRNMLRGETTAEKFKQFKTDPGKHLKKQKKPSTKATYIEGALTGSAATAATLLYLKNKKSKDAKAKTKKAAEEHIKKDKKKKEKHHSK